VSYNDLTLVTGYVFIVADGAITWASKKQQTVSLSTTKSKYASMADATCEAVWLQNLSTEMGQNMSSSTLINGDNQSTLAIANNPQYHKCTKHFDIKHHYIHKKIHNKTISVQYCHTEKMTVDIFTKLLPKDKFVHHKFELGVS
jgi:hypothetical protein